MKDSKAEEHTCVGCEFHEKCAGIIFGHIGFGAPPIVSGIRQNKWCENWRELEKQLRGKGRK